MTTTHLDPKHGRPGKLEGYSPFDLGVDTFDAYIRRMNPARAMRDGAVDSLAVAAGAAFLYGQDDVTVSLFQPGQSWYGGYYDGGFANMTALRAWIKAHAPAAHPLSITVTGRSPAMAADFEPGCIWPITSAKISAFYHLPSHDGAVKPWLYCSAGNLTTLTKAYRAAGIADGDVILWSAHYTGVPHFCGPKTCGYGLRQADATQYNDGPRDYDIAQTYCFQLPVPPPPPPPPAAWTYPAPLALSSVGGKTSFRINWRASVAAHGTPDHYVLWVYKGSPTASNLVAEYGPKTDIPGTAVTFEGGGLQTGVKYVAHLSAAGPNGTRLAANTFAAFTFTTG